MVGFDLSTVGEDERRRRRHREEQESRRHWWWVSIRGGFRSSLCHGEDENKDGGSVVEILGFDLSSVTEKTRDKVEKIK